MSLSKVKVERLIKLLIDLKNSDANDNIIVSAIMSSTADESVTDYIPVLTGIVETMDKTIKDKLALIKNINSDSIEPTFFEQCFGRDVLALENEKKMLQSKVLMVEVALTVLENKKRRDGIALLISLIHRVGTEQLTQRMTLGIPVTKPLEPVADLMDVLEAPQPFKRSRSEEKVEGIWSLHDLFRSTEK
jgi:hypothetical protein